MTPEWSFLVRCSYVANEDHLVGLQKCCHVCPSHSLFVFMSVEFPICKEFSELSNRCRRTAIAVIHDCCGGRTKASFRGARKSGVLSRVLTRRLRPHSSFAPPNCPVAGCRKIGSRRACPKPPTTPSETARTLQPLIRCRRGGNCGLVNSDR